MSRILWQLFYRALLLKSVTIVYRESNTIKYYDTLSVQFWMALALKVGIYLVILLIRSTKYYLGLTYAVLQVTISFLRKFSKYPLDVRLSHIKAKQAVRIRYIHVF